MEGKRPTQMDHLAELDYLAHIQAGHADMAQLPALDFEVEERIQLIDTELAPGSGSGFRKGEVEFHSHAADLYHAHSLLTAGCYILPPPPASS